ncbi:hypothetical protein CI109_103215 [Kwoniella shandongensis]|uniref:Uncharacterized protein n=1 Tax=Kwoniella shandongensis TaxID=1734106 RepID=A0A5M6CCK1_9TREE|nr:uncharacterized protein CI109_000405 [Kwoniella shandongensis]KAA5531562.1 hypothetical protein CI109_000405 [Kwoniella shandongensis]
MPSGSVAGTGLLGLGGKYGEEVSDSESSLSPSPSARGRCFCGRTTEDGGIYCSVACARSDAFSSLCYKPTVPLAEPLLTHSTQHPPSLASSISTSLSRNPSSASTSSTTYDDQGSDWNASHYRRLARADIRREERKEERRRRRAEGSLASSISTSRSTMMSTSSSASRAVPDLVGGASGSHSRNPSIASSITSLSSSTWGAGSLSRNVSNASSTSRRGYGTNVNVDAVIMEDDDEKEWLQSEMTKPYTPAMPISSKKPQMKRRDSRSAPGGTGVSAKKGKKTTPDPLPFGMGKDMRDVLEEIIQMEKSFLVSDNENEDVDDSMAPPAAPGLFTSQFDRPPRTPSPVTAGKKRVQNIQQAPGAPMRGHRSSASQSAIPPSPSYNAPSAPQRPPSLMGLHQSSLSESHTALYLATASPVASSGRRSASPKLELRRSISFTPDAAGPSISLGGLPFPRHNFDSISPAVTPSSRRHNRTPQAVHPAMDNWRFPSPLNGTSSTMATPTRPSQSQMQTPDAIPSEGMDRIEPALLWPAPPPNLQPSLFPSSPAADTPEFPSLHSRMPRSNSGNVILPATPQRISAPGSGMRLGVLLGSGDDGMDVDMEDDDGSTEQGHDAHAVGGRGTGYLPVFLEAEGFRAIDAARRRW